MTPALELMGVACEMEMGELKLIDSSDWTTGFD